MRNPPSQLFQPHLFLRPSLYGVFTILSKKRKRKKERRHKKNGSSTIGISFSLFFSEAHIKHLGMASKYVRILGLLDLLVMMLLMSASADFAKDRQECADQLVGLATCLPYVQGEGKAPTLDCCTGLKQVLQKSKKCLCVLIKDRDDPNLGFKINTTLALSLPTACNTPANMSECPALLQLPPGSPDAKIFEESGNSTVTTKSTPVASAKANSTSSGSSSEMRSGGWRRRRWVGVELVFGLLFLIVSHLLLSSL